MRSRRIWTRILGGLIVYGGAVLILLGIWVLSFIVLAKVTLPDYAIEPAIYFCFFFLAPVAAALWWSFSKYRWKLWLKLDHSGDQPRDLGTVVVFTEAFLSQQVPEIIRTFKTNFPGFDTSILGKTESFISRLRVSASLKPKQLNINEIGAEIDQLMELLRETTEALEGRRWEETREWQFVVYELTNNLKLLKLALHGA